MIKVKWQISMSLVGCKKTGEWEIDPEDWPDSEAEQNRMLDEMMQDELPNHLDYGFEVVGEQS